VRARRRCARASRAPAPPRPACTQRAPRRKTLHTHATDPSLRWIVRAESKSCGGARRRACAGIEAVLSQAADARSRWCSHSELILISRMKTIPRGEADGDGPPASTEKSAPRAMSRGSRAYPAVAASMAFAARVGVSSRPGRAGSSPMQRRIVWNAAAMRCCFCAASASRLLLLLCCGASSHTSHCASVDILTSNDVKGPTVVLCPRDHLTQHVAVASQAGPPSLRGTSGVLNRTGHPASLEKVGVTFVSLVSPYTPAYIAVAPPIESPLSCKTARHDGRPYNAARGAPIARSTRRPRKHGRCQESGPREQWCALCAEPSSAWRLSATLSATLSPTRPSRTRRARAAP
jgi:hypothetical protein